MVRSQNMKRNPNLLSLLLMYYILAKHLERCIRSILIGRLEIAIGRKQSWKIRFFLLFFCYYFLNMSFVDILFTVLLSFVVLFFSLHTNIIQQTYYTS